MLSNFGVVVSNKLYRCAQPTGPAGFETLNALNVELIVQLNGDTDKAQWNKLLWGRDLGTWSEFQSATLDAVEEIDRSLRMGRVVAVHCTHGRDRTGCVVAAYRIMKQSWETERALIERLEYGDPFSLWIWDHEIVEFLRSLHGAR